MSKRGRPPLPPERRRNVRVVIMVRPEVAEGMFSVMRSRRQELSRWTSEQFERFLARERVVCPHGGISIHTENT